MHLHRSTWPSQTLLGESTPWLSSLCLSELAVYLGSVTPKTPLTSSLMSGPNVMLCPELKCTSNATQPMLPSTGLGALPAPPVRILLAHSCRVVACHHVRAA